MRFVSVLLTNAVVAIVATRGDGSTMKSEIRRGRNREVLPSCNPAVSTAVVRRGVPTSDSSPHGKAALHRSPAPEPAVHPSSSWRGPRETTSSNPHRRLIALPQQPPLLWLLRGGESHGSTCTRRDERRASEEHQRVRNVLLFYPNLIGKVPEDANTKATYFIAGSLTNKPAQTHAAAVDFCRGSRYTAVAVLEMSASCSCCQGSRV